MNFTQSALRSTRYARHGLVMILVLTMGLLSTAVAPADAGDADKIQEEIRWRSDRRLSWDDFRGRPDRSNPMDALTESGISFSWTCDWSGFDVEIYALFDPGKSWIKGKPTRSLLAHEQGHFDITEIHARLMRKAFAETRNPCSLGRNGIDRIAQKYFKLSHQVQNQYDRETDHSEDSYAQARWEKRIKAQLEDLEAYAQ